jgi:hypothetical protein
MTEIEPVTAKELTTRNGWGYGFCALHGSDPGAFCEADPPLPYGHGHCKHCFACLPQDTRRDAKFCPGGTCRQAAYRARRRKEDR